MRVDRVYTRGVLATTRSASIAEAAAAMRRFKVGALLVMDDKSAAGPALPIGIITDRDLALEGFASESSTVGAAMTPVLATVHEDADIHEALEVMRAHGVRRLIVRDAAGKVCGIVSIDDIVDGLAADLRSAALVLKGDIKRDSAGLGEMIVGG
jgi:CBS domain-containing protein